MIVISLIVLGQDALGYESCIRGGTPCKWVSNTVGMSINTFNIPANDPLHARIEDIIERMHSTQIPGSALGVTHGNVHSAANPSNSDNVNVIQFLSTMGTCQESLALTDLRYQSLTDIWKIKEADIFLNSDCAFTAENYFDFNGPAVQDFNYVPEIVIAHEMMHVVGFDHEIGILTENPNYLLPFVAYEGWTNSVPGAHVIFGAGPYDGGSAYDLGFRVRDYNYGEDDRSGIRQHYPDPNNTGRDLSVQSYWKPESDVVDPVVTGCAVQQGFRARPEPRVDLIARAVAEGWPLGTCPADMTTNQQGPLYIRRGASLSTTFTFSNLGTTSETATYRYYLSGTPTPGGVSLATTTPTQVPNRPMQVTRTVTIPATTVPASYYLVVVADDGNSVNEGPFEGNNVAVYNRKLQVTF